MATRYAWLRVKGSVFTAYCALFHPRVTIGKGLRLEGRLSFRGPGRVTIGENVEIGKLVTPWTYSPDAHIRIGNNSYLNGTKLGCSTLIEIGSHCILADCRVMDSDFHSTNPFHRNEPQYIKSEPVRIGDRVWVTTGCVITKRSAIGRGTTVTPNSVVSSEIPESCIAGGNPAKPIRPLRPDELE